MPLLLKSLKILDEGISAFQSNGNLQPGISAPGAKGKVAGTYTCESRIATCGVGNTAVSTNPKVLEVVDSRRQIGDGGILIRANACGPL